MSDVGGGGEGGGKHKKGGPKGKKMSTHIDMTPMVDLAFLLLTFFMLATSFNKPKAMEVIMPEKPKENDVVPPVDDDRVLNILLSSNDRIFYYIGIKNPQPIETNYSPSGIRKVLMAKNDSISAANPKGMIALIKMKDDAKYRNMVDMFDEIKIAKLKSYALVPISPDEIKLLETVGTK